MDKHCGIQLGTLEDVRQHSFRMAWRQQPITNHTGDLFNSRLHYVGGLFYMHESGRQEFPVNLALVQFLSGGEVKTDSYAAFGQMTYDFTDAFSVTGGLRYTREKRQFNPGLQQVVGYGWKPWLY